VKLFQQLPTTHWGLTPIKNCTVNTKKRKKINLLPLYFYPFPLINIIKFFDAEHIHLLDLWPVCPINK
jgi:hypothetical protein